MTNHHECRHVPRPSAAPQNSYQTLWQGVLARWRELPPNARGIVWIALSGFALTGMAVLIKLLGQRLHVLEILFVRQLVMSALMAPRVLRSPAEAFRTQNLGLHLLRIGLSIVAMSAGFTAIIHLPMADAIALSFSRSFFVAIFAIIILKEIVTQQRWAVVGLGFVGIVIMVRPSVSGIDVYSLLGLTSAALVGLIMVIIRKLAQKERLATVLTYQAMGVGFVMAVPAFVVWQTPTPLEWALMLCAGLLSAVGQSLNFAGFRVGEATAVTSADYLRLIYATILGFVIFGEWPQVATFLGAALIIGTSAYSLHYERRKTRISDPMN